MPLYNRYTHADLLFTRYGTPIANAHLADSSPLPSLHFPNINPFAVRPALSTISYMSDVLFISGSPSSSSRSGALFTHSLAWVAQNSGFQTASVSVRDFPPEDLIYAKYDSPSFDGFKAQVHSARAVIISTPVYKASYTGALKALLDILPQHAFRGKVILPIATGGSAAHLLAIEYALKPLVSVLGATNVLQGVYVIDSEISTVEGKPVLSAEIQTRLEASLTQMTETLESLTLAEV